MDVQFPTKAQALFKPARYKVLHGGRGSGKSWAAARALLIQGYQKPQRILCAREFQNSIADSVHKLLSDQVDSLGLNGFYEVQKTAIKGANGTEFIFAGLRQNIQSVKSMERIDICWVEEAQTVSEDSWNILIPTIRSEGSEIWVTFNPLEESDPTYQRFVVKPPPNALVQKIDWSDNPWFPDTLDAERRYMQSIDEDAYAHIWGGEPRTITDAVIFGKRSRVETFETPEDARFYFGSDFGFAQDPTVLLRCFIKGNKLFVDYEAFGYGVEIDEIAQLYDSVPGSRLWPIKADSSRPETISYLARQGFRISGVDKWPGSVNDSLAHLLGFEAIIIHERCKLMAEERRLYRWKTDPKTNEVLPIVVDRHNHSWDSAAYALNSFIQKRGANNIWQRLSED